MKFLKCKYTKTIKLNCIPKKQNH